MYDVLFTSLRVQSISWMHCVLPGGKEKQADLMLGELICSAEES